MSLEQVRAVEERLRKDLGDVRGELARIVLVVQSAAQAERELRGTTSEKQHRGVNAAYDAMLDAIGVRQCSEAVEKLPP